MSMDEQLKTAYKQAIQDPCANLDKLSRLTPVLGEDGEPYCIDGSKVLYSRCRILSLGSIMP